MRRVHVLICAIVAAATGGMAFGEGTTPARAAVGVQMAQDNGGIKQDTKDAAHGVAGRRGPRGRHHPRRQIRR